MQSRARPRRLLGARPKNQDHHVLEPSDNQPNGEAQCPSEQAAGSDDQQASVELDGRFPHSG